VPYVPAVFGAVTREHFLERHWQRAPLMFRAAMPHFRSPISPDELAGLACEDDVESRLVQGHVGTRFRLEHGPFEAARFERLPKRDWTLLVQDVDKLVPTLAQLIEPFRFIPDWRIDDIMVSFAAPGGSVGPHTDQYDVFLLQAHGRRRWQLSRSFDAELRPDSDLKVLARFTPEEELIAEPGDILYLPPNVAHFGVALDEAMTFSIGFRAPDQRELMLGLAEELIDRAAAGERFSDPGRAPAQDPAELMAGDLQRLRQMIRGGLALSDAELDAFIGRYLTRSKPNLEAEGEACSVEEVRARLGRGETLARRPGSRLLHSLRGSEVWLFAEGHQHRLDPSCFRWLEPLLRGLPIDQAAVNDAPGVLPWLATFLERGAIEWQGDDD
jgi:50S ribosomal protein L16 3-hydroxylase